MSTRTELSVSRLACTSSQMISYVNVATCLYLLQQDFGFSVVTMSQQWVLCPDKNWVLARGSLVTTRFYLLRHKIVKTEEFYVATYSFMLRQGLVVVGRLIVAINNFMSRQSLVMGGGSHVTT